MAVSRKPKMSDKTLDKKRKENITQINCFGSRTSFWFATKFYCIGCFIFLYIFLKKFKINISWANISTHKTYYQRSNKRIGRATDSLHSSSLKLSYQVTVRYVDITQSETVKK